MSDDMGGRATYARETHALRPRLLRPAISPASIERPQLIKRMRQARVAPVTLVVAPSGYGKTTAVAGWLRHIDSAVAWLSLAVDDDDPTRLVRALVAALQPVDAQIGRAALAMTTGGEGVAPQELGAAIARDLARVSAGVVLVLDDVHELASATTLGILAGLIDAAPAGCHVVLISRMELRLPLEGWRAAGRLVEIGLADLRFDLAQTRALAERVGVADVGDDAARWLLERTGGWAALVRLALAQAARGARLDSARGSVLEAPGVDDVVAALVDSLLDAMPGRGGDVIAIAGLADAVCDELVRAMAPPEWRSVTAGPDWPRLDVVGSEGVLLTPVGDGPGWYRPHPLVRARLVERAAMVLPGGALPAVRRRAAAWLAAHGYVDAAARQAVGAGDAERAVEIVAAAGFAAIEHERWGPVESWLEALPVALVDSRPETLVLRAWNAYRLANVASCVDDVTRLNQVLEVGGARWPEARRWRAHGAVIARFGDVAHPTHADAVAGYWSILPDLPPGDGMARGLLAAATGLFATADGQYDAGIAFLEERLAAADPPVEQAVVLGAMALLFGFKGASPADEERVLRQLRDLARQADLPVSLAFATSRLGWLALRRFALEDARRSFEESASAPASPLLNAWRAERHGLALVRELTGDEDGAHAIAGEVVGVTERLGNLPMHENSRAFQAHLWLLERRWPEVDSWLLDCPVDPGSEPPVWSVWSPAVRIRAEILRLGVSQSLAGRAAVRTLIERADVTARQVHDVSGLATLEVCRALLDDHTGDRGSAVRRVIGVLERMAPSDDVLLFAEHGESLIPLLEGARASCRVPAFADRAIAAATQVANRHRYRPGTRSLSRRELDIVRLMVAGWDREEIAARCFIAVPTVRRHMITAYAKLGVSTRSDAVQVARSLGIVREA